MPDAKPSALLDHEARRVSEIDVINGGGATAGGAVGVAAPVNATLTAVVKSIERQWSASELGQAHRYSSAVPADGGSMEIALSGRLGGMDGPLRRTTLVTKYSVITTAQESRLSQN